MSINQTNQYNNQKGAYSMNASDQTTLVRNVMKFRQLRKLSIMELATASGLSRDTVARCEKGDALPTLNTLSRLSHGLGVPTWLLLDHRIADTQEVVEDKPKPLILRRITNWFRGVFN